MSDKYFCIKTYDCVLSVSFVVQVLLLQL